MKIVKKLAAWLVALAMVVSFLPLAGTEAYAVDSMQVSVSEDGLLEWENVWLSDKYTIRIEAGSESHNYTKYNVWEMDLYGTLDELAASGFQPGGGTYVVTVNAYHDDALQASGSVTVTYTPRVSGDLTVTWDGPVVSWDPVAGATQYAVTVEGNGSSQTETSADVSRIIDKLIKQGYLNNDKTVWNVRVLAKDDNWETVKYWAGTYEYESSAQYVEPEEITPTVNGTTVNVTPITGATTYRLEYQSYQQDYDNAQFDCQEFLDWIGRNEGLITDGSVVNLDVTVLDRDDVVLGTGTVTVTYTATPEESGVTGTIDIGNIYTPLFPGEGLFTTEINPNYYIGETRLDSMIYIEDEYWTDVDTGDVVTRGSGEFLLGHTYTYTVVINTSQGYAISDSFEFIVGGSEVTGYTLSNTVDCPEGYASVTLSGFLTAKVESEGPIPAMAKLSKTSLVYNGKVQKPAVTVTAVENGKTVTLKEGGDYELVYGGSNLKDAGSYYVEVRGINPKYDTGVVLTYKITPKKITPAVTLSASSLVYNGKVRKPTATVKDGSTKLAAANYDVSYAAGCKKVGTYKVTVKMKGNYSGTATKSFTIKPKKAVIYSAVPGKKQIKVTMSTKASATGGSTYQIKYRVKGSSSWKTTTTTAKAKTIKNLKKGKVYQVKVRAYKKVDGKTYYGAWSKIKTTKKVK